MTQSIVSEDLRARYRHAFNALREQIALIPAEALVRIAVDVPSVILIALGCASERAKHRAGIVAESPTYDMTAYDNLDQYAMALAHAHARHLIALLPPEPIPDLVVKLQSVRTRLTADAEVLATRNLLPREPLQRLRASTSYQNLIFDVLALVGMIRQGWDGIAAKTAVEENELEDAEDLTVRLSRAIGLRDHGSEVIVEATQTRQRAFTLFANAYNEVRRVVTFHRWHHEDFDRIAPSIYRGRGGRGKAAKESKESKRRRDHPANSERAPTSLRGTNSVASGGSLAISTSGDPEVKS